MVVELERSNCKFGSYSCNGGSLKAWMVGSNVNLVTLKSQLGVVVGVIELSWGQLKEDGNY